MGSGGENGGGGKCDMRERYAREHGEKKIDARRREREENDEMVLWKIASTSGHKRRGRRRENEGRWRKREKERERDRKAFLSHREKLTRRRRPSRSRSANTRTVRLARAARAPRRLF